MNRTCNGNTSEVIKDEADRTEIFNFNGNYKNHIGISTRGDSLSVVAGSVGSEDRIGVGSQDRHVSGCNIADDSCNINFEMELPGSRNDSVEEDMVVAERELAEDAQWKRIQQNTFTRWANEHLKTVNKVIGNLETDLSDGLRLITLVEVLCGERFAKYNKKPTFLSQKLENVSLVLKFLQDEEHIKIVNIDSSDIVDCKLKLILGLIWTLILHYSISMPVWDGDVGSQGNSADQAPTAKQRLLNWIQSKIPDLPIRNFTTDWYDGKVVGALVDGVAPGLCPDWQDWQSNNALQNAKEAMTLADDWLNVKQLIKPEELVSQNMDELSMMTYLSQYPNAKLKQGAPLRPRTNSNRVRAYGYGIEPKGVAAGAPARFTVETFSAGNGNVEVKVENPKKQIEPVDIHYNNDRSKTYTASYTPKLEGAHKVSIYFAGKEIPKSPYNVLVEGVAADASKVTVSGPGIQADGIMINKPTYFDIFTKDEGVGTPEVIIVDTAGNQNSVPIKVHSISKDVWRCDYVPTAVGPLNINVFYANQPIPASPITVRVLPVSDAKKVTVSGRGLQPNGIRVQDEADFQIFTGKAGHGVPEVQVIGPGGVKEPVVMKVVDTDSKTYSAKYFPKKPGRYVVTVFYNEQEILRSPFEVNVAPYKESAIRAYGPGLIGGIVGFPAVFTVDTNGETGALGFSIEGTSQVKIECHDNDNESTVVKYFPNAPGEYAVHILSDNEDIPHSPYIAQILPFTDYYPDKVECSGKGIGKENLLLNVPTDFQIDIRKAGEAPLDVQILDRKCQPVPVDTKHDNGVYTCKYIPKLADKHTIQINYGGVAVPGSPFRMNVVHPFKPEKVEIFGPGFNPNIKTNIPLHFTADCSKAGSGDLKVTLKDKSGTDVPVKINDNEDGTFLVDYCIPTSGDYNLNCQFGGVQVPQCPLKLHASPNVDISKIKVSGLETSVCLNSKAEFVVDSRDFGVYNDEKKVACTITGPSGDKTENCVKSLSDGTYKISYTPFEEGQHTIEIVYDGISIPGSPFVVNVKKEANSEKCKAYGKGLERGIVNEVNSFTVETKGAGSGGLGLAIEGPSEAKMSCKDNRDGSCLVEYVPSEPGDYDISIKFAEEHVSGSPFKVQADYLIDAKKVKIYGNGLDPNHCRSQVPCSFKIDASSVGKAPLDVSIQADRGLLERKPEVYDNEDGTFNVVFVPGVEGSTLTARILYNGENIPHSPFRLKVRPKSEPDEVKIIGPNVSNKGGVCASIPTDFTIDASQSGIGDLDVQILGPDSEPRKAKVTKVTDDIYKVTFTPDDCGLYTASVMFGGHSIPQSPFQFQAYATGSGSFVKRSKIDNAVLKVKAGSFVKRSKIDNAVLKVKAANECHMPIVQDKVVQANEEQKLDIDVKHAGYGKITCRIKSVSGKDADVRVEDNNDGTFSIFYKLQEAGEYTLNAKFGGQPVPGGLCTFTVKDEQTFQQHKFTGQSSSLDTQQYRLVHLSNIPLPTTGGQVTAEVKMPSSKIDKPIIEDNRDGTVSLKYKPQEEGLHELNIKYNGEHVQGSPFKFHVDSISSGYVTAYGPGLTHGVSGEPANFTIFTKGAGAGGLSLAIEGPSKAEISCHDNKDGTVSVSYLPTAPGEYKITVKFGDKHIKGSPYNAKVTGEGRKRNQISVGSCSEVSLPGGVTDADTRLLNASIQAPSGLEEPCFLKKLPSGSLGISFTPREVGEHVVSVKKMGKHVVNSPFKITVGEREVGDAKKVKVSGNALKDGKTHIDNFFTVDTRNAGYGGLSLSIEGPSKAEIQCKDNEDGTLKISYKPTEPGYYIINLKFADHHVDGSPYTVKVTGEGSNRQREKIERQREAVPITEVGSQCKLTFKMPGITPFDLSATVMSPAGVVEDAEINEVEDGLYAVHFMPKELGVHTVSVKYKDIHIPGSPFQFTVGPLKDGGAHRVHAGGPGLERGEQGQPCEFNIWTREAGGGCLAISVEGPSKAIIEFKDRKDGSCYVSYVVSEPGEYRVGIKFNDQHIPDSPYKLFMSPAMGDAHKLEVAQFPDSGVQADKPAQFLVHKNGAKGELDGKIISPSGAEDDCFIQSIDPDTYSIRFMPRENGIHNIHVKFNGVHILGSPFRIKVGKEDADPAAVHASGNGIGNVKTGHKTDFLVDTCNAGAGTLAVTIDGPSKVSMDCTEVEEGYKVRYTPLVPGDYYISLKYNGYHIVGSPFKVKCTGENLAERGAQETSSVVVETVHKVSKAKSSGPTLPHFKSDASKVTSKGMGLKKAYLQKQNQFAVHASDAGNNILYVGLYGPKGPCDEVFIKHTGRNNYQVNYLVREKGEYIIIVKWGEEHIPGSPFKVEV